MFSIEMSQKLESLEKQLAWQVEAKTAVEHDLNSLKQSLVVDGKGDRGKRNEVFTKLQDENSKLKESIRQLEEKLREKETDVKVRLITFAELEQKLEEKEADMKRQNRIQSRFIADLQSKLSQERQQREELRQSAETGVKPSPSETPTPPDTAVLTEALREKDRIIELNVQQLQKLEKTARDVTKIIQHSKHQSETIANLKEDLARAQVIYICTYITYTCTCTCTCMCRTPSYQSTTVVCQHTSAYAQSSIYTVHVHCTYKCIYVHYIYMYMYIHVYVLIYAVALAIFRIIVCCINFPSLQQLVAENEKALKASTEEMNGMRTHYENTLRLKNVSQETYLQPATMSHTNVHVHLYVDECIHTRMYTHTGVIHVCTLYIHVHACTCVYMQCNHQTFVSCNQCYITFGVKHLYSLPIRATVHV